MRYHQYTPNLSNYPIAVLVSDIRTSDILKEYLDPFGVNRENVLVLSLHQHPTKKKTPRSEMRDYVMEELLPVIEEMNCEYLLVGDAEYFKLLTGQNKADANLGYVMKCAFGVQKVIYVPNYRTIFYDPDTIRSKINQSMTAFREHVEGTYKDPGKSIIHSAEYPQTTKDIEKALERLLEMNVPLSIDIEAFSLKHPTAGIGTITFCWDKHNGIAFPVDYVPIPGATSAPFGRQVTNKPVRRLLRRFFRRFLQTAYYHSISYDVYILIYQLFMNDILDTKGLLKGMDIMLRDWDCTKLITYLATNTCAGNDLSLKTQAQEFAGNYAQEEIKDITRIPLPELLEYNLVDGLSTWFTLEKNYPIMVADEQQEIYETIFKPAMLDIIQMQLTGMPVDMEEVQQVKIQLEGEQDLLVHDILNNPIVVDFTKHYLDVQYAKKMNAKWKKKSITPAEACQEFNPNSGPQLQDLLFTWLKLPILNYTNGNQPSTDGETIEALVNHTDNSDIIELLENFKVLKVVSKITSSFIPALEGAFKGKDGWHYLFGNFNLGGTLSGRLSSSDPNLQNLPSTGKGKPLNAKYAKLIKGCFKAPPGWLFVGIDFNSLEDRISALTTKDPNKLKVYTDGYDGHSLRAYSYFGHLMSGVDPNSVASINSIAKKYKPLRDRSKNPTFTLTYQGTYHALVKKYGFTTEEAMEIEKKYHELYQVSDDWVNAKLKQATSSGYITAAFGLRLRTPLLAQVIRGNSKTPPAAEAEGRTAGNALGQSWCLLNSRAASAFMKRVRTSDYRYDIRPSSQIHDAQYYLIRDDLELLEYTNQYLVKEVEWQEHPDIQHPLVKLGGELAIYYPSWAEEHSIPNGANCNEIQIAFQESL